MLRPNVSFFDEDEEPRRSTRSTSGRTGLRSRARRGSVSAGGAASTDPQTVLVRRAVALGIGIVVLLLLAVAVNSCRTAQRKSSLRDYARQVTTIGTGSSETGKQFFALLARAGDQSPQDLQSQTASYRSQADQFLKQAEGLDVPSQMAGAQQSLLIALELRRDGLDYIAQRVRLALGDSEDTSTPAIREIAGQMRAFDASDVIFTSRIRPLVGDALRTDDVTGEVGGSQFLPSLSWLSASYVAGRLGQQLARGGRAANEPTGPGLHGTSLEAVSYGDKKLTPGTANELSYASGTRLTVAFTNSGENNEFDVKVTAKVGASGGSGVTATGTVPRVAKGETARVNLKFSKAPAFDTAVTITVTVQKVPGEENMGNNTSEYPAIFSR